MREIIFDTETTGLNDEEDRIIEIGAVELENRFPTGRTFHRFINPGNRRVHPDALAVHGITNEQLVGEKPFSHVVTEWLAFTDGASLVAHNAKFDVGFFNAEFARIGMDPIEPSRIIDTLAIAKRKHPMGPNSLDALCRRYQIDNTKRVKHGALLDSELLAEVYIELIGGKQAALGFEAEPQEPDTDDDGDNNTPIIATTAKQRPAPLPSRLTQQDIEAHRGMVESLGDGALWHKKTA
ncbi:MAG: DNA polymerase III subunit epsilon [Ahrensia sp.]